MATYQIYELSARAVMSYAVEQNGVYTFALNRSATEHCKIPGAKHEQDSCAMFHQLMFQLQGKRWRERGEEKITALSDVLFYMDFAGIFDRRGTGRTQQVRREKARDMFRPQGITLDFGSGPHRYVSFERSASMSRQSRLSFIRADLYEPMRRRIMLDMELDRCQLSKLYAYNGLLFSTGIRVDGIRIDRKHRVIVVDNPTQKMERVPVVSMQEGGQRGSFFRYEALEDMKITCFDGVGLISKEYAEVVDKACCGSHTHTSFQIRMPYIKGMLHQVDFKDFLRNCGTMSLVDIWGKIHSLSSVDIILTRSQFKAYDWLRENDMTWEDYWDAFREYNHALYITNLSKTEPEKLVELNYQFLSTISIQPEEFRPADLPDGWSRSPEDDHRQWLTKATETAYFNFRANERYRLAYFRRGLRQPKGSRANIMARVLEKNPKFIREPIYTEQLDGQARKILKGYAVGRLWVAGDNRFLSGDLLELMWRLAESPGAALPPQQAFYARAQTDYFADDSFFAPGAAYDHEDSCTLLRNPHIARNEELQLSVYPDGDELRQYYLGHLTDVVMVSADSLAAERLGGADYDGDLIKTIADPILNRCVKRNYDYDFFQKLSNDRNLPLLKIPALSAPKSDANDWQARFQTVENTFAARIGQICNAALDRSVIAYSERTDKKTRKQYRQELEALAILSGLEIDAAKTGVRPDLNAYIGGRKVKRTPFLQYKYLVERAEEKPRAWYEPTHRERLEAFFAGIDWDQVDSPVERLPWLARQLERNTPKIQEKPAKDGELFTFARERGWKKQLDENILSSVSALLWDYEHCLSRIRACRAPVKGQQRKTDIDRILYARGQEEVYDSDELYAFFQQLSPERIAALRKAIVDQQWHLLAEEQRETFLREYLPEGADYYDLLTDFRHGGFRLLGDLVCDMDDLATARERKQLRRPADSPAFRKMMEAYLSAPFSGSERAVVSRVCRKLLNKIVRPSLAVLYVVALGKRNLLWDLLPDHIEEHVLEVDHAE
ncbi:RNA dependent RNA polymerase [Dysosmobacter sp.]|uniref:RNA dependent RNA polymerase n=1 Tax=Dysosmobacter sp. TaxID=2591382 RepID=UPI003AF06D75